MSPDRVAVLTIGGGTDYNDFILPTRFGYPNTQLCQPIVPMLMMPCEEMGGPNDMKTPLWWSKQAIDAGK
ncbi:MAG: hypothetical protein R2744_08340 [Bacteroidales bacterium]